MRDQLKNSPLLSKTTEAECRAPALGSLPQRISRFRDATNTVPLPMGRQDIADFLGLTIETVSRTFTKLERDGSFEIVPAGVCLLDLERV
jgi:CRP/FNR family transcriptional regulator